MSIVNTLKDQCIFGFTGKVNILLRSNAQYIGEILIMDGNLVSAKYDSVVGRNSLFKIVFDDMDNDNYFKTIVEPEVVEVSSTRFNLSFKDFKREAETRLQDHRNLKTLKPPINLLLKIKPNFIKKGSEVSLCEFEILCNLVDKIKVGKLYNTLPYTEADITKALVSLKKKNALILSNA